MALRYLYANLKELRSKAKILEFVINQNVQDLAEKILAHDPKIVVLSTYIWNASDMHELLHVMKKVRPETTVIMGGPEISHFPHRVDYSLADYFISGEGEITLYKLCGAILRGSAPKERLHQGEAVDVNAIELPYRYYSDHDIANRYIYVESSRGCPFLCEFCLSSIDKKMRYFDLDTILREFETLWSRGVRDFKFIDRTFNLNMRYANAILDFFLEKEPPYFAHFEVIPESFPDELKEKLARFPKGSLQLEIGIQTLNAKVAKRINRPLHFEKIKSNIRYLEKHTQAHLHLDLIVGLPGESVESFGSNLNTLTALSESEIQVGILKKLSGTTLERHDREFGMRFSDIPPYDLLQNDLIDFAQMQQMKRFARFWDLYYNSGNFRNTVKLLFGSDVFTNFYDFSLWIYRETASTWQISLERLARMLFRYLREVKKMQEREVGTALAQDLLRIEGRVLPHYLKAYADKNTQRIAVDAKHKRQQKG